MVEGTLRNTADQKLADESIVLSEVPITLTTIRRGTLHRRVSTSDRNAVSEVVSWALTDVQCIATTAVTTPINLHV
ncbi:hypothetical protein J6590_080491 [Homalodisca vitripennis]|nr:hypothetical protein J6590_080491 [Homalodisca vitripennis]